MSPSMMVKSLIAEMSNLSVTGPAVLTDIVARNEQMRRVIRQCKAKLREKIKAQFRSNTPLSQLNK